MFKVTYKKSTSDGCSNSHDDSNFGLYKYVAAVYVLMIIKIKKAKFSFVLYQTKSIAGNILSIIFFFEKTNVSKYLSKIRNFKTGNVTVVCVHSCFYFYKF